MGNSMTGKILGLLISIFLIVGGLSGTLVLRFTNSSAALVVVGFVFLAVNIFSIATHGRNKRKREEAATALAAVNKEFYDTMKADKNPQRLSHPRSIDLYLLTRLTNKSAYPVYLNGKSQGEISPKNRPLSLTTNRVKNALVVVGEDGFKSYMFFEVTGEPVPNKLQKPGIQINAAEYSFAPQKYFVIFATQNSGLTQINP